MRPILAAALLFLSCQPELPKAPPPASTGVSQEEFESLKGKVDTLELQLDAMRIEMNAFSRRFSRSVVFSPDSTGYQTLVTSLGTYFVTLDNVTPYADGQKITFRIGNPYSSPLKNPTVSVTWAQRPPSPESEGYQDAWLKWHATQRSKRETFFKTLRPGWWTTITIKVSPAAKEDVGYIELSFDATVVSMPTQ